MCKRNTLVQEKYGVISRCNGCRIVDLTFGNFSMQLNDEDFIIFHSFIRNYSQRYANIKEDLCRDIKITTQLDNLQLIVCYRELIQLREMLADAALIMEAEELLN